MIPAYVGVIEKVRVPVPNVARYGEEYIARPRVVTRFGVPPVMTIAGFIVIVST